MSTREIESELSRAAESLSVPASSPPAIDRLLGCADGRRRRRTIVKRSVMGFAAIACLALVFASSFQRPVRIPQASTPVASDLPVTAQPTVEAQQEPESSLRLYARVRGQVPVFAVDRDAQRVNHVGWIESEQMIPVDMQYVPSQQQETFSAVFHQRTTPLSL